MLIRQLFLLPADSLMARVAALLQYETNISKPLFHQWKQHYYTQEMDASEHHSAPVWRMFLLGKQSCPETQISGQLTLSSCMWFAIEGDGDFNLYTSEKRGVVSRTWSMSQSVGTNGS